MEAVGINTPEELRAVEAYLRARAQRMTVPTTLSIVIPAYNEERFIGDAARADPRGRSRAARRRQGNHRRRRLLEGSDAEIVGGRRRRHGCTAWPSTAARAARCATGIALATGDYLIIQDADLEYDPHDYVPMLRALLDGRGDVVYGSRYWAAAGTPTSRWPPISAAGA